MKSARLYGFVGAVVVAGAVSGAFQDWGALLVFPTEDLFGLAILGLLALFSEALSLNRSRFPGQVGGVIRPPCG